jgi:hypothetical protein
MRVFSTLFLGPFELGASFLDFFFRSIIQLNRARSALLFRVGGIWKMPTIHPRLLLFPVAS